MGNPGQATRIIDKDDLAQKYGLTLEAGTFIYSKYSGKTTDDLLCRFTRCTGEAFPAPLPGINDGPACQAPKPKAESTSSGSSSSYGSPSSGSGSSSSYSSPSSGSGSSPGYNSPSGGVSSSGSGSS